MMYNVKWQTIHTALCILIVSFFIQSSEALLLSIHHCWNVRHLIIKNGSSIGCCDDGDDNHGGKGKSLKLHLNRLSRMDDNPCMSNLGSGACSSCIIQQQEESLTHPILTTSVGVEDNSNESLPISISSSKIRRKRGVYNTNEKERKVCIEYKSWTGSRGMLPMQKYRNPMEDPSLYQRWLKLPLPKAEEKPTLSSTITSTTGKSVNNDKRSMDIEANNSQMEAITKEKRKKCKTKSNKREAEYKASLELDPNLHLCPIYIDSHIVVVNKKSGVLSVPGPRRNPNVADLVHTYIGNEENDVDCMVVHRLDMDTSGVLIYARSKQMLSILHDSFRAKSMNYYQMNNSTDASTFVSKTYEALVCGHMLIMEGEIDLPLMRDRYYPPFMKVWTGESEDGSDVDPSIVNLGKRQSINGDEVQKDKEISLHKHRGYMKMMSKPPKDSLTLYRVLGKEFLEDEDLGYAVPVTRVELVPITGRTHQLRVHCAAIGHPIVGDNIYGIYGDGSVNGGFPFDKMLECYPQMASQSVQEMIYDLVQHKRQAAQGVADKSNKYNGDLCLHAKKLHILHPLTNAPMTFEAESPF